MVYLGIDIECAPRLAQALTETSARVGPIRRLVVEAEALAGLPVSVAAQLDEIESTTRHMSSSITHAANRASSFRVQIRSGFSGLAWAGFASAGDARWDADPATPWNDVHQEASHNSFAVDGGIQALYDEGVRTFELDIHRGQPTELFNSAPWPFGPFVTYFDHRTHGGGRPDDWLVYHHSADTESEYEYLSDGLAVVAGLDSSDPITVFLDTKNEFGDTHTAEQLDVVVRDSLGGQLFTPADLMARAPGAETLAEAIDQAGWPSVEELDGRVMIVLTDNVSDYRVENAAAFVAVKPSFSEEGGELRHLGDPNTVFYNQDESKLTTEQLVLLQDEGNLVRTYYGERCDESFGDHAPNFEAVDHEFPDVACEEQAGQESGKHWFITWPYPTIGFS